MIRQRYGKRPNRAGKALRKVGSCACKGLLWVCCGPCILCAICFIKPRRSGCVIGTQPYEPPRPATPEPRLRSLTLPLIEKIDTQKIFDQPQSTFICKLPLEIRRMIYKEMLGGVTIKLRTSDGKPIAQRYRCYSCLCRDTARPNQSELGFGLAMLRTCRQIYSEAIEYLYTSNTFSLSTWDDDHPTLDFLSYYFIPQRLIQIRDLRIDWEVDSFYYNRRLRTASSELSFEAWVKSWHALQALTGLRRLRIILYFRWRDVLDCYEDYWKKHEMELLQPLRCIKAPTDFVLVLPDRRCSTDVDLGDSKCVLQLPEEMVSRTELAVD